MRSETVFNVYMLKRLGRKKTGASVSKRVRKSVQHVHSPKHRHCLRASRKAHSDHQTKHNDELEKA